MKAEDYVKSLFRDFEETEALKDFMEEIQSNLEDKTASLVKKGLSEAEAFARASSELGDISALADEMSLKRRQEVYQDAYLGIRRYMKPPRVAGYIVFGSILVFGIIVALISYFAVADFGHFGLDYFNLDHYSIAWLAALGALLPFFVTSIAGFTFLGLTQESAAFYPMSKKRASWYSAAAGLIAFGLILFPLTYLAVYQVDVGFFSMANWRLIPALGVEIPFMIPGIGFLVFLCLTEKNRLKPWAAAHYRELHKASELWGNPAESVRFGLFSGAIWIFAAGLFAALGIAIGFRYSWLVFVFAIAVQLLVQALLSKEK